MKISKDGRRVVVSLGSIAGDFDFGFEAPNNWAATLLWSAVTDSLKHRMEEVRRQAYAEGWSDAKAKRKRKTSFEGWLP